MPVRALCVEAGHRHSHWWTEKKASPSEGAGESSLSLLCKIIVLAFKKSSQKLGDLKASDSVYADL